MANITVSDLVQALITVDTTFLTTEERAVMRNAYITEDDTGSDFQQTEYDRILQEGKTKVVTELRIDLENPPKDMATSLLRKCPLYLLPDMIQKFESVFASSHKRLEIAYKRFAYIMDNESDLWESESIGESFNQAMDICDDARNALMEFLARTNNPSWIELNFVAYITDQLEASTLVKQLVQIMKKESRTMSVSLLLESTLLCIFKELKNSGEKYTSDGVEYDEIISCLAYRSFHSSTLEELFNELIDSDSEAVDIQLCDILNNPNFDRMKILNLIKGSRKTT